MSWTASSVLAGLFTGIFLAGVVTYAAGQEALTASRRGVRGTWHQRERQRAYGWFTLAGLCWLGDVWLWLVVR